MTFDIPADVHSRVAAIPDLGIRIEMLLRHEAELEALRTTRYGAEAGAITAKVVANANRSQTSKEDRDVSFESLWNQNQAGTGRF